MVSASSTASQYHYREALEQEKGKNIWLMGGGDIIASFLDADAIDEFIVSIVPVFIGEGIPLIAPRIATCLFTSIL